MPVFPLQGGSQNTWGTELRDFFDLWFDLTTGDFRWPLRKTASSTTFDPDTDCILLVDSTTGDKTVSTCHVSDVPSGRPFCLKNKGANLVTLSDPDGRTIEGSASVPLMLNEKIWIAHDGTNWEIF